MAQTLDETRQLARSVTRDENGGYLQFIMPSYYYNSGVALPPHLPLDDSWTYYSRRDWVLLATPYYESMWASALGIAISKMASLSWEVESDIGLRRKKAQHWLLNAGAGMGVFGWVPFMSVHLRSYLCLGRAFVEIERATPANGSKVINIHHLNPMQCRLTGNADRPVSYLAMDGKERELGWHQVMVLVDMLDPTGSWRGGAMGAAERSYRQIIKLAAIENYVYEKVSGQRPLALYFLKGVQSRKLDDGFQSVQDDVARKGFTSYMGAAVIPIMGDSDIQLITIPLAELPDGFDANQERQRSDLIYADAIGLDPQDLNPQLVGRQGLGSTGNQSDVLAEKAKGHGLAAWRQQFMHNINELALDEKTMFTFSEVDLRDEEMQADNQKTRAETRKIQIESGEITPEQATNLAVDVGDLPREFARNDVTAGGTLSDTDKPEAEPDVSDAPQMEPVTDESIDDAVKAWEGVY